MNLSNVLPHPDRGGESQAQALAQAQEQFAWDWSWPPGCATLHELPRWEGYRPEFLAQVAKLCADMGRNHSAQAVDKARRSRPPPLPTSKEDLLNRLFAGAEEIHQGLPRTRPEKVEYYDRYFATIPAPPMVVKQRQDPSLADAIFAWQRVAGNNPMAIRRLTAIFEDFPLTESEWQRAIGNGSLVAALASGHIYGVDFSALHGIPANRFLGRQKYICGARAVFAAPQGKLLPVAIQLEPGGALFTPADGISWAMAKFCFNVADANAHETVEHLGRTHMVMEAVGIAAHRQLTEGHPLRTLLMPHLVGTFAVNESAKTSLIAPNGVIDRVFAPRIDVAASFVRKGLDTFVLQDCAPERELHSRGVDDPALEFPYRDDVIRVYRAIERFVGSYVGLYYRDDAAVSADGQLKAWVAEVGSPIGGALNGIRSVDTVAGLVTWMTNIIHLGSAQHSAVNFTQFPYYSWGSSVAGAMWAPPPKAPNPSATEADLLELMPPWDCLFLQADIVYELAGVYFTRLGDYPTFSDPRVAPIVTAFQKDLALVDEAIAQADSSRLVTYPFLRPSTMPASINI